MPDQIITSNQAIEWELDLLANLRERFPNYGDQLLMVLATHYTGLIADLIIKGLEAGEVTAPQSRDYNTRLSAAAYNVQGSIIQELKRSAAPDVARSAEIIDLEYHFDRGQAEQ